MQFRSYNRYWGTVFGPKRVNTDFLLKSPPFGTNRLTTRGNAGGEPSETASSTHLSPVNHSTFLSGF